MDEEKLNNITYKPGKIYKLGVVISISAWVFGYELAAFNPWQDAISNLLGWGQQKTLLVAVLTAIFPLGGLVGALLGTVLGNTWGRRKTFIIFAMIQAVTCAVNIIPNTYTFAIARFVSGVYGGIMVLIIPIYLAEISPDDIRGKVTLCFSIALISGQFSALAVGIPLGFGVTPWYWMAVFALPILFLFVQIYEYLYEFKYDTPIWLLEKGADQIAKSAIGQLYKEEYWSEVYEHLRARKASVIDLEAPLFDEIQENATIKDLLWTRRWRKIATICACFQLFNILGGTTSIYFYSNLMFTSEGVNKGISQIFSAGLGAINVVFLFVSIPIVDNQGRRPLLLVGYVGMTVAMVFAGVFALEEFPQYSQILMMVVFLFFFSHSSGPVGWVYTAEISNLNGVLIASVTNWISLVILGIAFPFAASPDGIHIYGVFWVFALVNFLGFWFTLIYAPETRGMDKRQISKMLQQTE